MLETMLLGPKGMVLIGVECSTCRDGDEENLMFLGGQRLLENIVAYFN